ncbi:MAG TPA: ATP-dependent protease subunit HslV [Planctomycetota bacterium]|nr:ATP-dependent protease subunit HslV [Planctomycetota bacterium]
MSDPTTFHGTTVIAVKQGAKLAIGGDGQVTHGHVVLKATAQKIRKMRNGSVIVGFAGSTADAFSLLERFEGKLDQFKGNLKRASVELAKEWRMDRALRRLEAMLVAGDKEALILLTGTGDVVEPDDGVIGIGSGGSYALAAARALIKHSTLSPRQVVEESLKEAAALCIYTNSNVTIEEL